MEQLARRKLQAAVIIIDSRRRDMERVREMFCSLTNTEDSRIKTTRVGYQDKQANVTTSLTINTGKKTIRGPNLPE